MDEQASVENSEPAFSHQSDVETTQVSDSEFMMMGVESSSNDGITCDSKHTSSEKRRHSQSENEDNSKKIKIEHDYDISNEASQYDSSVQIMEDLNKPPSDEALCKYFEDCFVKLDELLLELIFERYFLKTGGKLINYYSVKKKTPFQINSSDIECWLNCCDKSSSYIDSLDSYLISKNVIVPHPIPVHNQTPAISISTPVITTESTTFVSAKIEKSSNSFESVAKSASVSSPSVTYVTPSIPSTLTTVTSHITTPHNDNTFTPIKKVSISASLEEARIGTREQIVERAKQEAFVIKRIAELRQKGLWSIKRLPKVQEPMRIKTHWDYLLEEMQWLAVDFFQERKWKKNSAKRCCRMVAKYHMLKESQAERSEKEQQLKLKRIASNIAKSIKNFWSEIEKVVEAKQEVQLNEKRKKIQDMQLRFIVDKADHFTEKLAQEWVAPSVKNSRAPSVDSEMDSEVGPKIGGDDEEFEQGSACSDDDEETIAKEEAQENNEKVDYTEEINDLEAESEMPLEKLLELYGIKTDDVEADEANETVVGSDTEESRTNDSELRDILDSENSDMENVEVKKDGSNEINDIAAGAESLQPKGNTLSSVEVITKVPFLLKYSLREYQHIGLDWLVAMYEKNLNGILADEMGLGKTIQTIALIAHLACEKEIWGPHLIVVPTSVMLNWEMEFKKWCPALKLLTYYGSPKERKLKRKGWTKPNSFHVCITSYKLVVQDNQSFRRQKWVYLILDEAQHIKNFKSQRWQMLLNFNSSRRLLLTGTPLQNDLMELWSLMHFLMPNVFQSHQEFKDLFVNPVTGMIEGNNEYNENLVRRLHKVLRPFLLRRLKCDVEKQLPKKYEHVIRCSLSKRQRFLYDEFMSLGKTKETLASGNFLSVINILMQLRKVCNHPNLFDPRPTVSPYIETALCYYIPSISTSVLDYKPLSHVNFDSLNLLITKLTNYDLYVQTKMITSYCTESNLQSVCSGEALSYVRLNDYRDFVRMLKSTKFYNNEQNLNNAKLITNSSLKVISNPFISKSFNNATNSLLLNNSIKIQPKNVDSLNVLKVSVPNHQVTRKSTCSSNNENAMKVDSTEIEKPKIEDVKENVIETVKDGVLGVGQYASSKTVDKINDIRRDRFHRLAIINKQRCQSYSILGYYNSKIFQFNSLINSDLFDFNKHPECHSVFALGNGRTHCLRSQNSLNDWHATDICDFTDSLNSLNSTPELLECSLKPILNRFLCIVPTVIASPLKVVISHQESFKKMDSINFVSNFEKQVPMTSFDVLNIPRIERCFQLPELRLIQYDCGKLQILDKLLWQLKYEKHRVLIFTQMSRMLDIFEQFLNYHGHTYLRLDGSTKIDQRQALMERFNADQRIFCFILSTRSGGVGVNLTGADTVIFYDSDWNPTMDAQAQDRCHRIGQTRDVHIYRLICERTIEENILKKARQKKLLGDLAIEEGNFTTAFFKQNAIKDLFCVDNQTVNDNELTETITTNESTNETPNVSNAAFEQALGTAEEDNDVAAAKVVRAEAAAEFDEFDENIPIEDIPDEKSPEEEQIDELISQLTPVERYALSFVESSQNFHLLKQAEEEIEETKKLCQKNMDEWKKKNEERQRQMMEDYHESIMTCSREDSSLKKVFLSINSLEPIPIWAPPTPPQEANDLYIDQTLGFLYERTIMPESQLPPIFLPKEHKRLRLDSIIPTGRKSSSLSLSHQNSNNTSISISKPSRRNDDLYTIPKSPFDRSNSLVCRFRRELLMMKFKLWPGSSNLICSIHRTFSQLGASAIPPSNIPSQQIIAKSNPNYNSTFYPKWLIHEEFMIVLILMYYQDLPFNLSIIFPGHVPNWDFVSEEINSNSCTKRSPKICKYHFESLMTAKDDPRFPSDPDSSVQSPAAPTKQPKSKKSKNQNQLGLSQPSPYSPHLLHNNAQMSPSLLNSSSNIKGQANMAMFPANQPLHRISNILQSMQTDNNVEYTNEMNKRFDAIKQIVIQKTQTSKSRFRTHQKLFDHVSLLKSEYKINYDQPINVDEISHVRASRITRDKIIKEQKSIREQQPSQLEQIQQVFQKNYKSLLHSSTSTGQRLASPSGVPSGVIAAVPNLSNSPNTVQGAQQVIINQQSTSNTINPCINLRQIHSKHSSIKLQNLSSIPGDASSLDHPSTSSINAKINTNSVINLQSSSPNVHHVTLSQAQSLGLISQGVNSISSLQHSNQDIATSSAQVHQQLPQGNLTQSTSQFVVQSNQTGQQIPVNVSINQSQFPQKLYAITPGNNSQAGSSVQSNVSMTGQILSGSVRANPHQYKQILLRHQIRQQLSQQLQQQAGNSQISSPQRQIHSQTIRAQTLNQGGTPTPTQRFQIASLGSQGGHSVLTQSIVPSSLKQVVATTMASSGNTSSTQSPNSPMVSQRILSSNSGQVIPTSIITTSKGTVMSSGQSSLVARAIRTENFNLPSHLKQQVQTSSPNQISASSLSSSLMGNQQIFVQQAASQSSGDNANVQQSTSVPVSFVKSITPGVSGVNVSAIQISSTTASLLNNSNSFTIPISSNSKLIAQSISGGNVTVVPSSMSTTSTVPISGSQLRQIHLLQKRAQPSIQVSSTSMSQQMLTQKAIIQQSGNSSGGIVVSSDVHQSGSSRSSPNIISPLLQTSNSMSLNKQSSTFHLVPASAVQQLHQQSGGPITVSTKAVFAGSPTLTVQQMNRALKHGTIQQQSHQTSGSGQVTCQSTNHLSNMSASTSTQSSTNFILAQQPQMSPIKGSTGHYITVSSNESINPTTIKLLPTSSGTIAIQQNQQASGQSIAGSMPQSISTPKGHIIISGHAAASLIGQSGIVTSTSGNAIASSALLQQVVSNQTSGSNTGQTLTFAIRTAHGQQISQQQQPNTVHLSTLTLKNPPTSGVSIQHVNPTTSSNLSQQNSALVAALSSNSEHQNSSGSTLLRTLSSSNVSTKAIPIVLMQSSHNSNLQTSTPVSLISISNCSTSTTAIRTAIPSNKITTATQTSGATLGSILSAAAKAASSTSNSQYSNITTVPAKSQDSTLIEALMSNVQKGPNVSSKLNQKFDSNENNE